MHAVFNSSRGLVRQVVPVGLGISLLLVLAATAPAAAGGLSNSASAQRPLDAPTSGPALEVTSTGWVTPPGQTGKLPAVTRAANGDLMVGFATTADVQAGGEIRVTRSSNDGRSWSSPVTLATPTRYDGGSMHMSVGMTTLSDGTILFPFNEGVNLAPYTFRKSVLFMGRSTDNGRTWARLHDPVEFPVSVQEHWSYGRILELDDGSLLLPVWGTKRLADDYRKDPQNWRSSVLRSTDGGQTWSEYSTIAWDEHVPARPDYPNGANETSLLQLPDGRILAVVRFASSVGPKRERVFLSWSNDGGRTWSEPVSSTLEAQTPSLALAPCTSSLDGEASKILLGHRIMNGPGQGGTAVHSSFDGGVTWQSPTRLMTPEGRLTGGEYRASYPAFQRLGNGRLLVVFMLNGPEMPTRVAYNVLQGDSASECRAQAAAAVERHDKSRSLFVQREDIDAWAFSTARRELSFSSSATVREVIEAAAPAVTCYTDNAQLLVADSVTASRHARNWRPADPDLTLAQAGIEHGSKVMIRSLEPSQSPARAGYTELDAFPAHRDVANWADECDVRAALDYRHRSLGLELPVPPDREVTSVSLRDVDGHSRLSGDAYRLWVSNDNQTFREVRGWSLAVSHDSAGRLVHTFEGLSVTARYLKVSHRFGDTSYTFVLDSLREDVRVEYGLRDPAGQ